jgi:hypothetical protein
MVENPDIQTNVNFNAIDNGLFRYNQKIDLPFDIKVSGPVEQFGGPPPEAETAVVDVQVKAGGGTPTSIGGGRKDSRYPRRTSTHSEHLRCRFCSGKVSLKHPSKRERSHADPRHLFLHNHPSAKQIFKYLYGLISKAPLT